MRKAHILLLTATHVLAASVGGAIGVHILGQKLEQRYDELMAEEVAETKKFYKDLARKEYETPEEALKALHGEESTLGPYLEKDAKMALERYQGQVQESVKGLVESDEESKRPFDISTSAAHVLASEPEARSFIETPVPEAVRRLWERREHEREKTEEEKVNDWNEEQERKKNIFTPDNPPPAEILFNADGDPSLPYIISEDAYNANEGGQEQEILMFYTGDQTLVDEHEDQMAPEDVQITIGSTDLIKFGELSNDRNTVYIRNPKNNTDYYILRSDGSYGEEVAGFRRADE